MLLSDNKYKFWHSVKAYMSSWTPLVSLSWSPLPFVHHPLIHPSTWTWRTCYFSLYYLTPRPASSPFTTLSLLTLQSHDTADHDDVSSFPFLHIRHHLLDHADHPKEVGLKHFLHLFDRDAFYWTHQADTCVIDWLREEGEHKEDRKDTEWSALPL